MNTKRWRWTSDNPTQPGWYWWRRYDFETMILKVVRDSQQVLRVGVVEDEYLLTNQSVENLNGEWAGPLEPPR